MQHTIRVLDIDGNPPGIVSVEIYMHDGTSLEDATTFRKVYTEVVESQMTTYVETNIDYFWSHPAAQQSTANEYIAINNGILRNYYFNGIGAWYSARFSSIGTLKAANDATVAKIQSEMPEMKYQELLAMINDAETNPEEWARFTAIAMFFLYGLTVGR